MTTQPHMKTVDEIVEEFKELCRSHLEPRELAHKNLGGSLVDFLRQTLHQQRKEILEEAVRRIEALHGERQDAEPEMNGFSSAVDESITILQTLQKEV